MYNLVLILYIYVCLSTCLSVCLSVCPVCLSTCLSVTKVLEVQMAWSGPVHLVGEVLMVNCTVEDPRLVLFTWDYPRRQVPVLPSTCLSIFTCKYPRRQVPVLLSTCDLSYPRPVCLTLHLTVSLSVLLSTCLTLCLFVSFYVILSSISLDCMSNYIAKWNMRRAAAFWMSCKGLIEEEGVQLGESCSRPDQ